MGFTSFLARVGKTVATVSGLVTGFGPLFSTTYPKAAGTIAEVTDDLTKVSNVIQTVEVFSETLADKNIKGDEKLKAAIPQIAQIMLASEFMAGKHIKDQELFKRGCASIGSGMADILNSVE